MLKYLKFLIIFLLLVSSVLAYDPAVHDGMFYLNNGREDLDGSKRMCIDTDTGFPTFEKREFGIWQSCSILLSSNSVWVGYNVGLASAGDHLMSERADGLFHFLAHSKFDGEVTTGDTTVLYLYDHVHRSILQPDDTGTWTGTLWESSSMAYADTLSETIFLKTSSTAANQPIRFQIWEGIDDTGFLIFDQKYPTSMFTADTEVELDLQGYLEYNSGTNYFNRISSDAPFSIKTNSAETSIWLAANLSMAREDKFLQTKPWVSGDPEGWTEGDWLIDGRQILRCNTTGIQTGTFESNSDKWDLLEYEGHAEATQYWQRNDTTISPKYAGDDIETSGHLRVTGGGIFLERTGNDPYLSFVRNSTGQGQIRAKNGRVGMYSTSGSTVRFEVDSGTGIAYCYDDLHISDNLYVNNEKVVDSLGDVQDTALPKSTNWDTAYTHSQDNTQAHSDYLTEEVDPNFTAWDKSTGISITESQISDLDHFVTGDETDPIYSAWDKSTGISITESQISDFQSYILTGQETDPIFLAWDGDVPQIYNSLGLFKIQPDAQWDVELFGDTDVANNENGKIFKMWRRASEGNDYIRFYISANRTAYIHASNVLTLQAQNPFVINSVTDYISFKVGDNAGVKKVYFKDSDGNIVTSIDSEGWLWIDANMGGGLEVNRGTQNNIQTYMDWQYTDLRFAGDKDYNRIGTWVNKPFQIVTNSLPRVHIGDEGYVGVGTVNPYSFLTVSKDTENLLQLNRWSDTEDGTAAAGMLFGVRTDLTIQQKAAILFKRTGTYGRGDLVFAVNNEEDNTNASLDDAVVTIDRYGRVETAGRLTVGDDLEVADDILAYEDISARNHDVRSSVVFQDKSTQEEAGERHFSQGHTHTAIYSGNWYDADTEDAAQRDMHFSPDGLTMYMIGLANGGAGNCSIWEYPLTIPWDLSTVGSATIENIDSYGSNQVGLFISIDGRRLWTVCTSNDTVIEYSMSPWNISSLSWVQAKDISGQETSPSAIFWSANGDRLFVAGDADNDIVAFSINHEWDISGLTWFEDFGTDINAPTGLHFSSDGRRMYVMDGSAEDDIHEFHLSSPWLISTARLVNLFDVSSQNGSPQGIFLTPDNSKIFMVGTSTPDGVYGYSLGLEVGGSIISNNGPMRPGRMTTAQRDALTAVNGDFIYNTTTEEFNFYEAGAWVTK